MWMGLTIHTQYPTKPLAPAQSFGYPDTSSMAQGLCDSHAFSCNFTFNRGAFVRTT